MFKASKGLALGASALVLGALLAGCGGDKKDANTISVGVISGPEEQLMEAAKQEAKQRFNLDVKIVEFTDYVSPNASLSDGSIDANAYQHQPYMDSMNKERGYHLVAAGKTFIYPIGAYSKRHTSIDQLQDGATIGIPNDPSNEARALLVLAKAGLITLKDNSNPTAGLGDITNNPHNFKFQEIDAAQLPRSLDDVDLAVINSNFAQPAGYELKDALLKEGPDSPYVNLIVVRDGDQDKENVKHLVEAFQTDAVANRAEELFHGGAVPGWK